MSRLDRMGEVEATAKEMANILAGMAERGDFGTEYEILAERLWLDEGHHRPLGELTAGVYWQSRGDRCGATYCFERAGLAHQRIEKERAEDGDCSVPDLAVHHRLLKVAMKNSDSVEETGALFGANQAFGLKV